MRSVSPAGTGHLTIEDEVTREVLNAWKGVGEGATWRLTVLVDPELSWGSPSARQTESDQAAIMMSLPWELIHDL